MEAGKAFALHVNPKDNVAVVLSGGVSRGTVIEIRDHVGETVELTAKSNIPYGHKIAVRPISKSEKIIKYGEVIGGASVEIAPGEHVHVHNMDSLRGRGDLNG